MVRLRPSSVVVPAHRSDLLPPWVTAMATVALSFPLIAFVLDTWIYQQAEQAYGAGRCEGAIAGYTTLLKRWRPEDWQSYEARSQARIHECTAYQTLVPLLDTVPPREALLTANQFLNQFPHTALLEPIQQHLIPSLETVAPETLVSLDICEAIPAIRDRHLLPNADQTLPTLLYGCGQLYRAEGRYNDAIDQWQQFLKDYPDHEKTAAVKTALAAALIDEVEATDQEELPPPVTKDLAVIAATRI